MECRNDSDFYNTWTSWDADLTQSPRSYNTDGTESIDGLPDDTNESVAIQRIKESMKEEVKKFEYDNHVPPAEYF